MRRIYTHMLLTTTPTTPTKFFYRYVADSICQSIGSIEFFFKYALVWEKCLFPKNPLCADNPEGCADFNTKCSLPLLLMSFSLSWAFFPHSKNTIFFLAFANSSMALSVNCSHPFLLCEFAAWARTVKLVLSISIPCDCHFDKSPCVGILQFKSDFNSLYMFNNELGVWMPLLTLKQRPIAWL